ncbi:MAG: hypothetical protein SVT56_02530 [Chloroflexota bacterium]|jgi:hypothetical protein|nr:hypothetical protein [Chloroflexota bacterium]
MLILLPIGLLLGAALAVLIQDRARPRYGTSWLIAVSACIISWVTIMAMRLRLPTTLDILSWDNPDLKLMGEFSLLLDYDSWPYAMALITITLAVILTDSARTRYDSTPRSWSASMLITALGLLAIQSGSSLTLLAAWVIVDIIELIYLLRLENANRYILRIVISFGVRTASIFMMILAAVKGWQINGVFALTHIPQITGFIFLLAAGLRLGVFPLNLPFLQEPTLRRGAGNIIRLAPIASSLCLLARLPNDVIPPNLSGWVPLFHAMLALAAIYASFRWLSASDEIEGRPFWIITWAALATESVINGNSDASLAWGIALILPGSLLFLYYPRVQRMNFLLHFGLISLVGLPYTPLASAWSGLISDGINIWTFTFLLAHAVMVFGYLNRTLQPGGEAGALESWARIVYPLGMILIIQTILALGLIGWPGSLTMGIWWLGLISTVLVFSALILIRQFGITPPYIQLPASSGVTKALNRIVPKLEPLFRLEWLYQLAWRVNNVIGGILQGFSTILEGEGGILWTILLLVLLVTILMGGGAQ